MDVTIIGTDDPFLLKEDDKYATLFTNTFINAIN